MAVTLSARYDGTRLLWTRCISKGRSNKYRKLHFYQLRQLRPLICSLSFDAASPSPQLLVQVFVSICLDYCNSLLCGISDNLYRRLQAVPQHASSPTREGASTSRPSCSSYIGFQSANVFNSRSPCWCTRHCTTSCLRTWWKTANLCLSLDTDDCIRRTPTCA